MAREGYSRWRHVGADGVLTLFLSCLLIVATAGLSWLLMLLRVWYTAAATPTDAAPAEWVVVLGRRLLGSAVTLEYAARLRRAEALYRRYPHARIMLLGGYTSEGPFSEAQQGRNFLHQRGIPDSAIHIEGSSHHTLENLQNARRLVGSGGSPRVLVSSRYHLARCHTLAEGLGLRHNLCAAEDRLTINPRQLRCMLKEAFFLHWYWVGKIWSTITRNHKSLARIS